MVGASHASFISMRKYREKLLCCLYVTFCRCGIVPYYVRIYLFNHFFLLLFSDIIAYKDHSLKNIGKITRNNPGLILVDGASGGVGMATIAIAKAMGSKVIAGVSTENKMHHPKAAGADVVLCYGTDKETYLQFKDLVKVEAKKLGFPAGVDVVVDVVQGDLFESALISCVRPLGVICLVGFTAGQKPIRPGLLLVKEVIVAGSIWGRFAQENPGIHRQNVEEILNFFSTGAIKPRASTVFPIEEFADTFELFESNKGQGNNVIEFLPSPRL